MNRFDRAVESGGTELVAGRPELSRVGHHNLNRNEFNLGRFAAWNSPPCFAPLSGHS
jgi:hypothetical protein